MVPGHALNTTTLCFKDHHSQSSADWPPEAHNQSQLNHTASSRPKHKHFKALLPHRPHKSSPHFLCEQGNNMSSQPRPLQTIINFRMVPSITPAHSASLTDMASPLTSCHTPKATWWGSKVAQHPGYAHLSPWPSPMPQSPSVGS